MSLKERLAADKAKQPLGITPVEWARFQQDITRLNNWQRNQPLTAADREFIAGIVEFVQKRLP